MLTCNLYSLLNSVPSFFQFLTKTIFQQYYTEIEREVAWKWCICSWSSFQRYTTVYDEIRTWATDLPTSIGKFIYFSHGGSDAVSICNGKWKPLMYIHWLFLNPTSNSARQCFLSHLPSRLPSRSLPSLRSITCLDLLPLDPCLCADPNPTDCPSNAVIESGSPTLPVSPESLLPSKFSS